MASRLSDETTTSGEGVVPVSIAFIVSVGKTGIEDVSQKCLFFGRNLFRCRIFSCKCSDSLTWVRSKIVKRSLNKGDVARKRSLFRVKIVQSVSFGILMITNKNFLVALLESLLRCVSMCLNANHPKTFKLERSGFSLERTFRRAFYLLVN